MKIQRIKITKLFDYFDYTINFNDEYPVSILHAQNGMGKTTILTILYSIFIGDIQYLFNCNFMKFEVSFDSGFYISVEHALSWKKRKNLNKKHEGEEDYLIYFDSNNTSFRISNFSNSYTEPVLFLSPEKIHELDSRNISFNFSSIMEKLTSIDKTIEESNNKKKIIIRKKENSEQPIYSIKEYHSYLQSLRKDISISFIDTNRLNKSINTLFDIGIEDFIDSSNKNDKFSLENYSEDLRKLININSKIREWESESIDSSFPERLIKLTLDTSDKDEITIESINAKRTKIKNLSKELIDLGIFWGGNGKKNLYNIDLDDSEIKPEILPVLNLYLDDCIDKLELYSNFRDRLKLFLDIINSADGFCNKKMSISHYGITFKSTITREKIPIDNLSSGEKHIFVMFYQLIFSAKPGKSIILIDEPEISMHITWQEEFITYLKKICELRKLSAIVTTHSPNILNGNFDMLTAFDSGDNKNE